MYKEFDEKVELALKGDIVAKEWIIHSLKPLIASYSKRYGLQVGWNDELYQEGAIEILEALKVFDKNRGVPFLGFITVKLKHYYQNKRRSEKVMISLDESIGDDLDTCLLDLLVDERVSIENDYLKEEKYKALGTAIHMLNEKEREIIKEYYFNGKMLKDIARNKNVHYVTAAKNKAKALEKLKKCLEKIG